MHQPFPVSKIIWNTSKWGNHDGYFAYTITCLSFFSFWTWHCFINTILVWQLLHKVLLPILHWTQLKKLRCWISSANYLKPDWLLGKWFMQDLFTRCHCLSCHGPHKLRNWWPKCNEGNEYVCFEWKVHEFSLIFWCTVHEFFLISFIISKLGVPLLLVPPSGQNSEYIISRVPAILCRNNARTKTL